MKKLKSILLATVLVVTVLLSLTLNTSAASSDSQAGVVSITSGSLNVRSTQSTSSAILTKLSKGSYVTLISKSGSWWYVEYSSGRYGYCSTTYIQQLSSDYVAFVNIASGNLNVRTGAGTGYSVQNTLTKNTTIIVISQSGNWSRILYNGTSTGYVSSAYIKAYSSGSNSAYSAVSLSVPSFKQTDSRWSSYPIGTNGGTIGTIGCATTAIAMMESYKTGTTVTPPVMASRLSYSAGGSVYWPTSLSFNFTNSYATIYNYLKDGKPVMYGVKNSNGSQHWVVITGYTGGSTLTASGFTINDPGSNSRTNLQQLLNSYPTFYKYAV